MLHGLPRLLVAAAGLAGLAGAVWSALALPGFDMCGLRPVRDRWVRHPLYSSIIVLLWADPRMSVGRLVLHAT